MNSIIALVIAYLIGSISTSIILSKFMQFPDPRSEGSGNAGASNILRNVGKNEALMVLLGDIAKGILAVLIGRILGVPAFALGLVALAAVAGHVFPVFHHFKGGKGVATSLGAVFVLNPLVGIFAMVVWVALAYFVKYASLASLVSVGLCPILLALMGAWPYIIPTLLVAALVGWCHWENIERLRAGTETKIDIKL